MVDIEGQTHYARTLADLPTLFHEVAEAWAQALEADARFSDMQQALRERNVPRLKALWNTLVPLWDDRTFYDFVAQSDAFARLSFHHREVFGQVGFGTGGWDSDFPNSMLEILRVVLTGCDENQHLIEGGVQQVPMGLWAHAPEHMAHWPAGTTLASLHQGAPRPGVTAIGRAADGQQLTVTDTWGTTRTYPAVLVTCQSWLMTTQIAVEESLFSHKLWMALDRTRYMQSSKTFVMVDRPFWKDKDPATGRDVMSMTLTDRLTRGTYLFDHGPDQPGVICLSYAWMGDALKMLPHNSEKRVELALSALKKIYPTVDIASHIIGEPITISWEADPYFLGRLQRVPCPATTATTTACTATSCKTSCPRPNAASSSPATTCPGHPPGWKARCRPRSTPCGASCTSSVVKPTRTSPVRATSTPNSAPWPCPTERLSTP